MLELVSKKGRQFRRLIDNHEIDRLDDNFRFYNEGQ